MRPAFLLIIFLSPTLRSLYTCQGPETTVDLNVKPVFYVNYTQIAAKQNCLWNFSLPLQYAADIQINGWNMGGSVQISSQWGGDSQTIGIPNPKTTPTNDSLHVMWPPTSFTITILTFSGSTMIVTVNVTLKPMSDDEPTYLSTAINKQPYFIQFMNWKAESAITVQSNSSGKLSIAVASPDSGSTSYQNVFVYTGSSGNLQFLGTLLSLIVNNDLSSYTSKTDTMTFYRAMDDEATATLLINDMDNMKHVVHFQLYWSPYNLESKEQSVNLDARVGLAVVTVLNEPDGSNAIYLERVGYPTDNYTSPVTLMAGGMIQDYNSTLLETYRDSTKFNGRNYPQFIPGMSRTFVLEQGSAFVYYTAVAPQNDSDAVEGRNGFVMSSNYPFLNENQDSEDFALNSVDGNPFMFMYTVRDLNCSEGTYLNFTLNSTDNVIVDIHNLTTVPATFNLTALTMTMSIVGGKDASSGTFIPYIIHNADYSGTTTPAQTTSGYSTPTTQTEKTTTTAGTTTPSTTPSPPPPKSPLKIILIGVGVVVLLVVIIVIILCLRYRIRRGKFRAFWATMSGILPIAVKVDQWELGDKQLEILEDKILGKGEFGVVYEGELYGDWPVDRIIHSMQKMTEERDNKVAVKRLPLNADIQARVDFMEEINFMKKLGYHPHVLGMIGCITATSMPVIVLDLCENGDLLSWIRKNKYSTEMTPEQLLSIAWQISDGLCHLKSLNLIHRDLAARNILLTKDIVAKISDFGLCRKPETSENTNTYLPQFYVSRGGRLPVKWLAPESLKDFQFSTKTDLWSYGVILWEMYTFGDVPFGDVNPLNLYEVLESGERLPQGAIPDEMYKLMASCWDVVPGKRKPIEEIKETLSKMLASTCNYYLTMSADGDASKEEDTTSSSVLDA